jgi:hypothetical protein
LSAYRTKWWPVRDELGALVGLRLTPLKLHELLFG